MPTTLEATKSFKRVILDRNVKVHLQKTSDWKVARAVSTGEELPDADKNYRAAVVAEYNRRIAALDAAESMGQVTAVRLVF